MNPVQAEQSVLGGLMLATDQRAALASLDWLTESDFASQTHQLLWRAIVDQAQQGRPADAVTMGEYFESNGIDAIVGGASYILELANNTPSAANITAYAEIVVEHSKRRKLALAGREIAATAEAGRTPAAEIAMAWHPQLLAMTDNRRREAQVMRAVLRTAWAEMQEDFERQGPRGLLSPWAALNRLVPDIRGGELVVIGGRPGMGKSTVAVQIASTVAMSGRGRVMLFSLEMPATQVARRVMASVADVPLRAIRNPEGMDAEHWPRLTAAMTDLSRAPLVIDDQAGLGAKQIAARARREHLRDSLRLVVIDHFHRLDFPGKDMRAAMTQASAACKDLARELGIPVILAAQLNRAVEKQGNPRPTMADLRECGALEQDADWVVLLYRDEYYQPGSSDAGVVEAIVAKARDGETGTARMRWRGDVSRIDDLPDGWERPAEAPRQLPRSGFRRMRGDA